MKFIIEVDTDEFKSMKHIDDPGAKFYLKTVNADGTEEEQVQVMMMWAYPDIPRPREGD